MEEDSKWKVELGDNAKYAMEGIGLTSL